VPVQVPRTDGRRAAIVATFGTTDDRCRATTYVARAGAGRVAVEPTDVVVVVNAPLLVLRGTLFTQQRRRLRRRPSLDQLTTTVLSRVAQFRHFSEMTHFVSSGTLTQSINQSNAVSPSSGFNGRESSPVPRSSVTPTSSPVGVYRSRSRTVAIVT